MNNIKCGSESAEAIARLKDAIAKEVRQKFTFGENTDIYFFENEKYFYDVLNQAKNNANIGIEVPPLTRMNPLSRRFARLFLRATLKVLKVITINQRLFNHSVIGLAHGFKNYLNILNLRFVEAKTKIESRLINIDIEIDKLKKNAHFEEYVEKKIKCFEEDYKRCSEALLQEMNQMRATIDYLKDNIALLKSKAVQDSAVPAQKEEAVQAIDESSNASFYMYFENYLRGSRAQIKERLSIYIPYLDNVMAGTSQSPVLDMGCGRGEFLELLKEHDFQGLGIDLNEEMVKKCNEMGLAAKQQEALSFLLEQPDASYGAITAFHLIEHIPFNSLINIVSQIFRVLKPGGLVVFETPNPNNVIVGSCSFYMDPTHLKPIPNQLARFMVQSQGFVNVDVLNIHPYDKAFRIDEEGSELAFTFNEMFYGPQDYAVIGYKI